MTTGLVYDNVCLKHDPGKGHPEQPARLTAVLEGLLRAKLPGKLRRIAAPPCEMEWLEAVHTRSYIDLVRREIEAIGAAYPPGLLDSRRESGQVMLSTGDTNLCRESWMPALLAAGGAVAAVRAVLAGEVHNAFCAVRPPGHHAGADYGMGFCVFNNVAVACRWAQRHGGVKRVLIVDWDVHHGNGTQDIFYRDPTVFYCSAHQAGHYPLPETGLGYEAQRGEGPAEGTNLNIPLPAGSGDEAVLSAWREKLLPAAKAFAPELLLISAGFDSREGDPLGGLNFTDDCFAELTRLSASLVPAGRVVSVLEGGYDLAGLALASAAHVRALME